MPRPTHVEPATGVSAGWLRAEPASLLTSARLEAIVTWTYGFLVVALVAGHQGGFFPSTWAWTALLTWWIAALALALKRRFALGVLDLAMVGGTLAYAGWFALSATWSQSVPSTLGETTRYVAYAGIVVGALLLVERRTAPALLGGVASGLGGLALYALASRLLEGRPGGSTGIPLGDRLSGPITYWNGLGITAVMAFLLVLGFATRAERTPVRAGAGALLPGLALTAYFTFSRGAPLALAVGLAAAIVFDPHRFRLALSAALLCVAPAATVLFAARSEGLVDGGATYEQAAGDRHELLLALILFAGVGAAVAVVLAKVEERARMPSVSARTFAVCAVSALAIGVFACWLAVGSPSELAARGWAAVQTSPTATDHNGRFLDLSSNGRLDLWRAGWDTFVDHPVAGLGGGTFAQAWAASPLGYFTSPEGHSVYVETLAELGVVGLALLFLLLLPPVASALRARRDPLVPLAVGAYAAWLVHAGLDWDWELLGVSGAALLIGVGLVASGRDGSRTPPLRLRGGALVAASLLLAVSVASVIACVRLESARDALASGNLDRAVSEARSVRRYAPWSIEGLELIASVEQDRGRLGAARRAYREIVRRDPHSWIAWAHLSDVAAGAERRSSARIARRLNPHQRLG